MVTRLVERLSFRQARSTVVVALLLGLLVTAVELFVDVRREREAIADTVRQVVRVVQDPAAKASYDLDRALASKVLDGLFSYRPIYFASLHNEFGRLGVQSRMPDQAWWRWLTEWVFGGNLEVRVPLHYHPVGRGVMDMGEIRVRVDIHLAAASFLNRAGTTLVNGLVRNVLLGLVLTAVFHFMVTKPILAVSRDMERVTPDDPGAHRVSTPEGHRGDEIGLLVGRINALLSAFGATLAQRDQYAADLLAARRRAEEASLAKSQFLATMSHELRTPLTAIIGFSELIRSDASPDPARHADYAGEILAGGNQLLSIINDILELAEIDGGGRRLTVEPVDVRLLLDAAAAAAAAAIREKGLRLRVEVEADVPAALGDPKALRHVVANLLSNAAKFTARGGEIRLSGRAVAGRVEVRVADTGVGIPPENIGRVVEPFWQGEDFLSRRYGGTGLGLPLAKALVDLHEGTMRIESEVGAGTTVVVEIPACDGAAGALPPAGSRAMLSA